MHNSVLDKSTVIGLVLGGVILIVALLLGNVPISTLLSPEAILVVFGGTVTATMVSFKQQTLLNALSTLKQCFYQESSNPTECVNYAMDVAGFARQHGVLALQPMLGSVEIPFLRKGLALAVDSRDEEFIRNSLTTEIEVSYRDNMDIARVFETAGGFAPTMGIIGAVIGLIYVVQAFQDPTRLGQGVASAFSATLYGVALSNLFLLPLAGKLRQRARDDGFVKTLLMEAVLSIAKREHPMVLEEKLNAYIGQETMSGRSGKTPYATQPQAAYYQEPAYNNQELNFLDDQYHQPVKSAVDDYLIH